MSAESLHSTSSELSEAILSTLHLLQTTVEGVANGQNSMLAQKDDLVALQNSFHQVLTNHFNAPPETITATVTMLQNVHAKFAISCDAAKCNADKICKLKTANNELQVQLAKAHGAHGQVHVEKDNFSDQLKDIEIDCNSLCGQVVKLQAAMGTHGSEVSALELQNSELEDTLLQSLARLKMSDVAAQSNQEHIAELEKVNKDATVEQQALKAQVRIYSIFFSVHQVELVSVAERSSSPSKDGRARERTHRTVARASSTRTRVSYRSTRPLGRSPSCHRTD